MPPPSQGRRDSRMTDNSSTSRSASRKVRVDGAHHSGHDALVLREQLVPVDLPHAVELDQLVGCHSPTLVDQMQRQALELGQHLESQRADLDRRESEFHARVARIENDLRTARLVCAEREIELQQRAEELVASPGGLNPKIVAEIHGEDAVAPPEEAADVVATLPTMPFGLACNNNDLSRLWEQRLTDIEKSERGLQAQVAQLEYDRRKLAEDRAQFEETAQSEQKANVESWEQRKLDVENEIERLNDWSAELDSRQLAVEALYEDASRMVREAIEMRLATEQLCGRITMSISTTEMTQRLAGLRCQLMDQFHLANERARQKKQEIEALLGKLADHQETLQNQRRELRRWFTRRNAEIEADASKLLQREGELKMREEQLAVQQRDWAQQRHEYQQRVRRLQRMVHSDDVEPVTL